MKKISFRRLVPALVLSAVMPLAFAGPVTIFEDDFDRADGNSVGNGWYEIEGIAADVAITANTVRLRSQAAGINGTATTPDAALTRTISTVGVNSVAVAFTWSPYTASESSDFLNLAWKKSADVTYTNVGSLALGGQTGYTFASFHLGAMASNTSIDLRFWTNVNANNEGAFLNSVKVTAVPEPGSIALMSLALAGMGLVARRKRK
ncbi:MAG: hypothetical protein JWP72_4360 [Massilia sp.]|nr:hypothetical protein [Massilia sp.]